MIVLDLAIVNKIYVTVTFYWHYSTCIFVYKINTVALQFQDYAVLQIAPCLLLKVVLTVSVINP